MAGVTVYNVEEEDELELLLPLSLALPAPVTEGPVGREEVEAVECHGGRNGMDRGDVSSRKYGLSKRP